MISGLLADEHALRIAARAFEHRRRNQPVVQDHICLLKQLQRAKGEQVRVTGAGTDQVTLTQPAPARTSGPRKMARTLLALEILASLRVVSGEDACPDDATDDSFPEGATCGSLQRPLHSVASLTHKARQGAESRGQKCFHLFADTPRENGSLSTGADGNQDRRTIDNGRENKRGSGGVIHHVHGDVLPLRGGRYGCVDLSHSGRGDDSDSAVDV